MRIISRNFLQEKAVETTNQNKGKNRSENPCRPIKPEERGEMPQHRHHPPAI
jgi:hypothetical protein